MTYKRVKQLLLEGGFLEIGELVVLEEEGYTAVVEVLEVDRDFIALWSLRYTIHGNPPANGKFEVRPEDRAISPVSLSEEQRSLLSTYVGDSCMSCMFGDGLERDYIIDGFPAFKGIANMTDAELLQEAGFDSSLGITLQEFFKRIEFGEDIEEDEDE